MGTSGSPERCVGPPFVCASHSPHNAVWAFHAHGHAGGGLYYDVRYGASLGCGLTELSGSRRRRSERSRNQHGGEQQVCARSLSQTSRREGYETGYEGVMKKVMKSTLRYEVDPS